MQFRAKGDAFLQNFLEGTDTHVKYLSPGIQNQLINICTDIILSKIVSKVNEAQCFSVLADETADISTSEQLTLCVRYIDSNRNLNENFLKFIEEKSLTGSDLSAAILDGKNIK